LAYHGVRREVVTMRLHLPEQQLTALLLGKLALMARRGKPELIAPRLMSARSPGNTSHFLEEK
jgi:hypothetical protein